MKKQGVTESLSSLLLKQLILLMKRFGVRRQVRPSPPWTRVNRAPRPEWGPTPGGGTRALARDSRALTSMKEALM